MAKKKKPANKKKPAAKKVKKVAKKKPTPKAKKKPAAKKATKKIVVKKKAKAPKKVVAKKIKPAKTKPVVKKSAAPVAPKKIKEKTIIAPKPEASKMPKTGLKPFVIKRAKPKTEIKPVKPVRVSLPAEPVEPKQRVVIKFKKEVKSDKVLPPHPNQFSIEYLMHASPGLIFEMVTDPTALSEWFADEVSTKEGFFTFYWDGTSQTAKIIGIKENQYVRFQWTDKPAYTFFEFKIDTDELTNEVSLTVTDFVDDGDVESAKMLWNKQISVLKQLIGS